MRELVATLPSGTGFKSHPRTMVEHPAVDDIPTKYLNYMPSARYVIMQMDIVLDSEINLWNKRILLDGHSFSDSSFYNKDASVLFGEDIRNRFTLPMIQRKGANQ